MAGKVAYIFDFDETLVTTTARIHVYRNGAHYKTMNSKEYNFYKSKPGDTFDFSDFKDGDIILSAKKYKMWPVLKNISDAIRDDRSQSQIYILTARAPVTQSYIYEFLKSHGIEIKLNHIITIGDDLGKINISEEKHKKLAELAKNYAKVVFFDDDPKNIAIAAGIQGIKTRLVENEYKQKTMIAKLYLQKFKEEGILQEDMGGVSAPMATVNNTPGMGNAVPPSKGGVGSGDTWGNKLNKKPYTQAKKKKKVVKKPKLEEENINPYDKVGMAMAKKMGVKTPFKKKKSKGNQNSMVQRKFEHQIITLDEFTKKLNENK